VTTRRSSDLGVPPVPRQAEPPPPANVRRFPFIIPPDVVLEMAQRLRERATEGAVARHKTRKGLRSSGRPTHRERGQKTEQAGV
jgi:hypothetical protein